MASSLKPGKGRDPITTPPSEPALIDIHELCPATRSAQSQGVARRRLAREGGSLNLLPFGIHLHFAPLDSDPEPAEFGLTAVESKLQPLAVSRAQ